MKKLILILLCALTLFSACAEGDIYFASENQSFYHEDALCTFGSFAFDSWIEPPFVSALTYAQAENASLRPCPACARAWKPVFSCEFPEWTGEDEPWRLTGRLDSYLPYEIRKDWGDLAEYIYQTYDSSPYPDGYAGLYRNACGGYTLLLVQPTLERIEEIRSLSGADFWVLEADYDMNTLLSFQNILVDMMDEGYGIHSVGISEDGNCVIAGVDDDSPEIKNAVLKKAEEYGCAPDALVIRKEERAQVFF